MQKSDLIILCDVDNTINKFSLAFKEMVEEEYYDSNGVTVDPSKQYTFEMSDTIVSNHPLEIKNKIVRAIFKRDDFWKSIKPIPMAIATLAKIKEEFDCKIVFATTPYTSNKNNEAIKIAWLKKYIPFEYKIVFSDKKWTLPGDIIIDDKPETLLQCRGRMITVKPLTPYNRGIPTDLTISYEWSRGDGLKLINYIEKMFY